MKTKRLLLVGLAIPMASVGLFGQASFRFANYDYDMSSGGLPNAPVYDWAGNLLSGPEWRAELYGGLSEDSLAPVIEFGTGVPGRRNIIGLVRPGYFHARPATGDLVVWDAPAGGMAWLEVRVWTVELGATYEEAVARGLGGYGASALFYARGGDPGVGSIPSLPGPLIGLQSFSVLRIVPEPSTWLLLALGLGGLACRVRRRR